MFWLLLGCPDFPPTGDGDGDGDPFFQPNLCGEVFPGDCATLPDFVEIWSVQAGETACFECLDPTTCDPWEDRLVGTVPVEGGVFEAEVPADTYGVVAAWEDCTACTGVSVPLTSDVCTEVVLVGHRQSSE